MHRAHFIKLISLASAGLYTMKLNALENLFSNLENTPKMPVIFFGHGSPMNAIEENEFVKGFKSAKEKIPTPKAILCISAHWETRGTFVTAMPKPKTIHDFGGFPQALFDVQYPAPGSPELAREISSTIGQIELDHSWGLDHGTWSVIKHLYPQANIPVLQLSLNRNAAPQEHYSLAQQLQRLRSKGILIIGSGNIVHNLGQIAWQKINETYAFDWNTEVSQKVKSYINQGNHKALMEFKKQGKAWDLAIPTSEHYLPLLYCLALQNKDDKVSYFNDLPVAGSLSMTSVVLA